MIRLLALFLVLGGLALAGCGDEGPAEPLTLDGARLFVEQNCVQCHGDQGQGTMLGPVLVGKGQYWKREDIAQYLTNPQVYIKKDKRLTLQADKFMLPMTPFVGLTLAQRLALADHVLALK